MYSAGGDNLTIFTGQLKLCGVTLNYSCSVIACGQRTNQQQQAFNARTMSSLYLVLQLHSGELCHDVVVPPAAFCHFSYGKFQFYCAQRWCWYLYTYMVLRSPFDYVSNICLVRNNFRCPVVLSFWYHTYLTICLRLANVLHYYLMTAKKIFSYFWFQGSRLHTPAKNAHWFP